MLGLRFTILVIEKWIQGDRPKFEVILLYIARYSLKIKQKTRKDKKHVSFIRDITKIPGPSSFRLEEFALIPILRRDTVTLVRKQREGDAGVLFICVYI